VARLAPSARFRRWAMRYSALHGERLAPGELIDIVDDVIGCEIGEELLSDGSRKLEPLHPVPCPVTLAWGRHDRLFPIQRHGARAQALIPQARFLALDDVGHVPMIDDPGLVAETILAATAASPLMDTESARR
jgi:pimeloyl-ACP methyl ester carboxylesterase